MRGERSRWNESHEYEEFVDGKARYSKPMGEVGRCLSDHSIELFKVKLVNT